MSTVSSVRKTLEGPSKVPKNFAARDIRKKEDEVRGRKRLGINLLIDGHSHLRAQNAGSHFKSVGDSVRERK